jgi:ABC-type bacteriocin/lantibiotic exporter with double-glycine peptidase domain
MNTESNMPSFSNERENLLLGVLRLANSRNSGFQHLESDYTDPLLSCIDHALGVLGDKRDLIGADGSIPDVLEANNIVFRQISVPHDLRRNPRNLLLVIGKESDNPMIVYRLATQTVVYDPTLSSPVKPFHDDLALKPFGFELYARWPSRLCNLFQLLRFSFHRNYLPLLAVLFSSLIVALFNLSIPTLTSFLVSTVLPIGQTQLIAETSLVVLLIAISTLVAQFFSSLAQVRMESLLNLRVETALWSHLLMLPLEFFSRFGTADLITRVASVRQMRQLASSGLLSTGLSLVFSISNLVLMFTYQTQLAFVALIISVVSCIVMIILVFKNSRLEAPLQDGQARLSDLGLQAVNGMAQIRVGGNEPFIFDRWFRSIVSLSSLQRRGQFFGDALEILGRVLNPLGQTIIFGVFVYLLTQAAKGNVSDPSTGTSTVALGANQLVASFVAFQAAYISFNGQLSSMTIQLSGTISKILVLWQRSKIVMFATAETVIAEGASQHTLSGNFDIRNLQISYPDSTKPVLRDISLAIPSGTYTAITGPSGCGKTTLMRAILRLMAPDAGVITADGIDVKELAIRNYRRQFGVVLQNTPLPTGSIYDIVRAGRSFSRDEVWDSLRLAGIQDDVMAMGMRLETLITDGAGSISGGQRQRLALARALIGQPRVLVLDEATSALDAATQAHVTKTLSELPITRIAIAHRLSTIESAHQIVIIKNGVVVENGRYSELTRSKGGYLSNHNE